MANYIFFKSLPAKEGSFTPILSILPNQAITTPSGSLYNTDPSWRVAHGVPDIVAAYPDGTAFSCREDFLTVNANRNLYSIKGTALTPVSVTNSGLKSVDHTPHPDAVKAFAAYTAKHPDWAKDVTVTAQASFGTTPLGPKKMTVLEQIHKDYPVPTIKNDKFHVNTIVWDQLVRNVKFRKRPTMLTGPTGTGKTELIRMLGEKLSLPVHICDMGSMHDPLAQLIGQQGLVGGENGSVTEFQYAPFTELIQQPGIILLDELSRAPQQANNILFPLLDKRRCLYAELAGDKGKRVIQAHPECVFLATANIGSAYTGTETLDEALSNRFDIIDLDYLSREDETALLVKVTGINENAAKIIASVCEDVRRKFSESKLSRPLSARQSILAAENVADGWDVRQAMTIAFEHLFDGTGGSSSERSTVRAIICSK